MSDDNTIHVMIEGVSKYLPIVPSAALIEELIVYTSRADDEDGNRVRVSKFSGVITLVELKFNNDDYSWVCHADGGNVGGVVVNHVADRITLQAFLDKVKQEINVAVNENDIHVMLDLAQQELIYQLGIKPTY